VFALNRAWKATQSTPADAAADDAEGDR